MNYNETTNGDISGDPASPLALDLAEGVNSLQATSAAGDIEYVTVTVPEGSQLDSVELASYTSEDEIAFAAVQEGSVFTEPPTGTNVENLLGYSHFGADDLGDDILDNLASGEGAIGFTSPLPSGEYTFWLQQTGEPSTYTLDFNVSAASSPTPTPTPTPEPTPTPTPTPGELTVSLQSVTASYDGDDNLLAPSLVRSLEDGASVLTYVFNVDGEIPEEGVLVTVNGDVPLTDYFANLGGRPFSPGGEVVEAVYNDAGEATGFTFRIFANTALINLPLLNTEAAMGDPVTATYTLEAGEGYSVDDDASGFEATFYNTLADAPAPTVTPEVSVSISESNLIESEGTSTTLTFTLSEPPPEGGVLVYVDSGIRGANGEFDVLNAEIVGGVTPAPNFSSSGFYFKILEQEASITLSAFPDDVNPETGETTTEGIEAFTFAVQEGPGYTVSSEAGEASLTIADTPDSQLQVSYTVEPTTLVESEATVGVHTFNLSSAPPEGGITVSVSATNLADFNLDAVEVTGGEITRVNETGDGFHFKITEQTATINLPILDDTEEEFLERATFTLESGEGYQVNANANGGTFTLVNTPDQVLPPTEGTEPSDTIELAQATNLSAIYPEVSISGAIDHQTANRYETENGFLYVDFTEDVDLYKVDLKAGDVLRLDVDARQGLETASELDSVVRLFDAAGTQLAISDDDGASDEVFVADADSYLEYTAETDGSYYVGISSYPNGEFDFFDPGENKPYDPLTPASGTGRSSGDYALNLSLNSPIVADATVITPGMGEGPAISLQSTAGAFDGEDNLLASTLVQSLEDGASLLTLGLSAEGEIPEGGVEVILNSNVDLGDFFSVNGQPFSPGGEVLGAVYDAAGNPTGIRFRLDERNAIINLAVANLEEPASDGEAEISFSLEPSAGYTVTEGAETTTATIYDTLADVPELPTVAEVGLTVSETALVESEGNATTLTFSLSEAPPEDGILVYVDSGEGGALGEFDVLSAEITGGSIPAPNFQSSGFYFRILDQTASITLSAFDETTIPDLPPEEATEGIEEFTYTLQPGVGYAVDPDASEVTLTIADNPDSVVIPPPGEEEPEPEEPAIEPNDTIAEATLTNLSAENSTFTLTDAIDATQETRNLIDASEDVDLYAVELGAGDTITVDVDSIEYMIEGIETPQRLDSVLRLFDAEGEQLLTANNAPAPDEIFAANRDAYLEFTAEMAGTYYVGVGALGNTVYDPFTAGSGSGRIIPASGINIGEYELAIQLTPTSGAMTV